MRRDYDYAFDHPVAPTPPLTAEEKLVIMAKEFMEDGYRLSGLTKENFAPTDANCDAAKDRAIAGRQGRDPAAYELRLDTLLTYFREARIVFEENPAFETLRKNIPLYQEAANAHALVLSERGFFHYPGPADAIKAQPCKDHNGVEYGAKKPQSVPDFIPAITIPSRSGASPVFA